MKQRISLKQKELPFISIIIVTYNGSAYIIDCLRSLKEQTYNAERFEIIAVDNNSVDKTPEIIENTFRDVHIVRNRKNLGFGKANNIGIKKSKGQYVVLLNQDSLVDKEWLRILVKTMEENQNAGCCGAEEYSYDAYKRKIKPEKRIKECIWMGCGSVIFRKKALEDVGFFDPFYFMYVEDIDLVWRLKCAGWKILQNYEAQWFHKGKERRIEPFGKRVYWSWKNRIYLLIKFGSLPQVVKSLFYYGNLFLKKKELRKEGNQGEAVSENKKNISGVSRKQKVVFLSKLFLALQYTVCCGIIARIALRQKQKMSQQEVDSWIAYTDRVFYSSEYN